MPIGFPIIKPKIIPKLIGLNILSNEKLSKLISLLKNAKTGRINNPTKLCKECSSSFNIDFQLLFITFGIVAARRTPAIVA